MAKSVKEHRVKENFGCLNVVLDDDDMNAIKSLTPRHRYITQEWALQKGQNLDDLWDGECLG